MNDKYLKKESASFIHEIDEAKSIDELPTIAPYGFTYGEYLKYFEKYIELLTSTQRLNEEVTEKIEWLKDQIEKNPKIQFKVVAPYTHTGTSTQRELDETK